MIMDQLEKTWRHAKSLSRQGSDSSKPSTEERRKELNALTEKHDKKLGELRQLEETYSQAKETQEETDAQMKASGEEIASLKAQITDYDEKLNGANVYLCEDSRLIRDPKVARSDLLRFIYIALGFDPSTVTADVFLDDEDDAGIVQCTLERIRVCSFVQGHVDHLFCNAIDGWSNAGAALEQLRQTTSKIQDALHRADALNTALRKDISTGKNSLNTQCQQVTRLLDLVEELTGRTEKQGKRIAELEENVRTSTRADQVQLRSTISIR
jgi:chromosome segregation ATPase